MWSYICRANGFETAILEFCINETINWVRFGSVHQQTYQEVRAYRVNQVSQWIRPS